MKKILSITAAVAALALVGATDAGAVCANALTFGQTLPNCGGGYCYVVVPGGGQPSGGSFWSLTTGNAAVGSGDDNGGWPVGGAGGWCREGGPGCYLTGTWAADNRIDGCIDGKLAPGKTVSIMVAQFSHQSGSQGFYAATAISRNNQSAEFEFSATGQNITLAPIPAPNVTGTVRTAPNVAITVASPNLSAFTSDGPGTPSDVIKGYRVYKTVVARNAPAPTSRARSAWTAAGASTTLGGSFTYTETACATNSDIYLATAVVYDSNIESDNLSANSRQVQCGPTIADPKEPQFKVIPRKEGASRDASIK